MIRKSVIALAALATLAGAAAPAFADTNSNEVFDNSAQTFDHANSGNQQASIEQQVLDALHARGVNATSIDRRGNLIQAFVTARDGRQTIEYFTPGSLQPVTPTNG
jgi:hypothetical protein